MVSDNIKSDSTIRTISFVLLFSGFVLRAQQYLFNRSLWLDEAMLALNIADRSFAGLTQPLSYNQGAPLGFLFIQKLAITMLGNHDYILRLFPFISSAVSLLLFHHLAAGTTKGLGRILATFLFSISGWLIYYASECKQYSSDVAACLLVLLCGQRCIRAEASSRDFITLALGGVIALWLSHPALFVCCGAGLGLVFKVISQKKTGNPKWVYAVLCLWSLNFLILYVFFLSRLSANSALLSYWNEFFMPLPPWQNPAWFSEIIKLILIKPTGLSPAWPGGLLIILGLAVFLSGTCLTGLMLTATLLITLLASGLQKYPFGDRLLLFAVPIFLLCIGKAVEQLGAIFHKKYAMISLMAGLAIAVSISYLPTKQAIAMIKHPHNEEDIKTVLTYVAQRKQPGDALYIYYSSIPAFSYYAPQYSLDRLPAVQGISSRDNPLSYMEDVAQLSGNRRVWFIFSHNYNWGNLDEVAFFEYFLPRIGSKQDEIRSQNAAAFLFSMK